MNRHPAPPTTYATPNHRLLRAFLDDCARRITRLPECERVGWVVYLLEQIAALAPAVAAHRLPFLLDDLRADIAERIQTGSW